MDSAAEPGATAPKADHLPTAADVAAAAARIAPYIRHTPLLLADFEGRRAMLKLEQLQISGSFKLRGALNSLLAGPRSEQVVTASGGNHGLGLATAARILGLRSTVFVPSNVPASKAERITAAGAELIRVHGSYTNAAAAAVQMAARSGCRYVPAYDEALVVAGQGTVALEAVADAPAIDSIVVAVGGGGLAAGCALGSSGRPVIGVEPDGCCALHQALEVGHPVDTATESVAVSALGATRVGALPFAILSAHPLRSVLVSDPELLAARDLLWEQFRLAVEPAASAGVAAWLAGLVEGQLPCLVLCGANTEWRPG
jgi:threonine dehydratase